MTKGDHIKLLKPMGAFTNVGEICEVTNITQDGVISFRFGINGMHLGCMSYNEFEKYFELVNERKRQWTKWKKYDFWHYDLIGNYVSTYVEYRTNGKKVQLRCSDLEDDEYIKAEATCSKVDTFVLNTGLDIAGKRLKIKLLQEELKQYINKF